MLRCASIYCVISPKTAAILTVNGQCGTTSLTWILEKYGLFSHSRSLPWNQCPAIYLFPFIIQASVHSYSAHWLYFNFSFRCNEKGWRAESCTDCLETKLFSGLPTYVYPTFQLSFFVWKNIGDFLNSEFGFRLLFTWSTVLFLICQSTFKAKLLRIQ